MTFFQGPLHIPPIFSQFFYTNFRPFLLLLWISTLAMVLYLTQTQKILVYPRFSTIIFCGNRENKKYPYIDKYINSQPKLFIRLFLYLLHGIWIQEENIYQKIIDFKKHLKYQKNAQKTGNGPLKSFSQKLPVLCLKNQRKITKFKISQNKDLTKKNSLKIYLLL